MKSASWAVVKTSGTPPAAGQSRPAGTAISVALVDDRELGLPAAADDPHHAVADREARGARAELGDLAGELEPGDVRAASPAAPGSRRRSCIMSAPLSPAARTRTSTSPVPGSGVGVLARR